MSRERAVELIRRGNRFLVTCHVKPDADALGSALGLAAILRELGKAVELYSPDGVPRALVFLEGVAAVRSVVPEGPFDATFVMDAAARALVPSLPDRSVRGPLVIVDHHAAADDYGDLIVREVDAAATAEIVLRMVRDLGFPEVPRAAAQPLYAAIVADTGGFRYAGTNPETHRLAARLLELGVDPWYVASHLFERWPRERMALLAEVLRAIQTDAGGRVATVILDRAALERTGATDDMVEGMVNFARMLEGVEIAALLWVPAGCADVKVSLRSGGRIDVARIAVALGGGGHRAAAGASVRADLGTVARRVREEALRALEAAPEKPWTGC